MKYKHYVFSIGPKYFTVAILAQGQNPYITQLLGATMTELKVPEIPEVPKPWLDEVLKLPQEGQDLEAEARLMPKAWLNPQQQTGAQSRVAHSLNYEKFTILVGPAIWLYLLIKESTSSLAQSAWEKLWTTYNETMGFIPTLDMLQLAKSCQSIIIWEHFAEYQKVYAVIGFTEPVPKLFRNLPEVMIFLDDHGMFSNQEVADALVRNCFPQWGSTTSFSGELNPISGGTMETLPMVVTFDPFSESSAIDILPTGESFTKDVIPGTRHTWFHKDFAIMKASPSVFGELFCRRSVLGVLELQNLLFTYEKMWGIIHKIKISTVSHRFSMYSGDYDQVFVVITFPDNDVLQFKSLVDMMQYMQTHGMLTEGVLRLLRLKDELASDSMDQSLVLPEAAMKETEILEVSDDPLIQKACSEGPKLERRWEPTAEDLADVGLSSIPPEWQDPVPLGDYRLVAYEGFLIFGGLCRVMRGLFMENPRGWLERATMLVRYEKIRSIDPQINTTKLAQIFQMFSEEEHLFTIVRFVGNEVIVCKSLVDMTIYCRRHIVMEQMHEKMTEDALRLKSANNKCRRRNLISKEID